MPPPEREWKAGQANLGRGAWPHALGCACAQLCGFESRPEALKYSPFGLIQLCGSNARKPSSGSNFRLTLLISDYDSGIMQNPEWMWNEFQQVGTDYESLAEVEIYDRRMGTFRDVVGENRDMLTALGLPRGAAVLEIGCGTGWFARAAAGAGLAVTAIDVSEIMLRYVAAQAQKEGFSIATQHAGFLTMDFPAATFDAAVSGAALHHLPDAWKLVALRNIARALKPGGQLILRDVVFSLSDGEAPEACFTRFIESFGEQVRPNALGHIKKEFSTYDWIMEGLLTRAGFEVISRTTATESFLVYHCRKSAGR